MDKERVIARICDPGIVAVVRAKNAEEAKKIADSCLAGGVCAIEITFTVPGASKVIEELAQIYKNGEMLIGAGTVLDAETARIAILAGAQFVVSPYFDEDTARLCNRYRVAYMPGVMTIKEVISALELGCDILKLFPGEVFGPKMIKAINGPLPQAKLMPTGGVDVSNVEEWIKAGAVAVGAGSSLTAGAKTGDYNAITEAAKQFVENIKKARS